MKAYQYFLVSLIPDPLRNEQINIGVIGLYKERIKPLFLKNPQKIKAISPDYDTTHYSGDGLVKLLSDTPPDGRVGLLSSMGDDFVRIYPPAIGYAKSYEEFEMEMLRIFDRLVKPVFRRTMKSKITRLKTAIKKKFEKSGFLGEKLSDKKIVTDFIIVESENLVADFAYMNGSLNIIETIDFNVSPHSMKDKLKETALASIKINEARNKIDKKAKGILLYVPPANDGARIAPHQSLLESYYDRIVNYDDRSQVSEFHGEVEKDLAHSLL